MQRFGYTEISPDAARVSVNPLPGSIHHTKRLEASSPQIKDVMQKQTWPSLSPLYAASLVPEQKLLVEASTKGPESLKKLMQSWRTAFLVSGLVIKQKGDASIYLSLGPWPNNSATAVIPLERVELEGSKLYFYRVPSKIECHFKTVLAFADWSVLDTVVASPLRVALMLGQKLKVKTHSDLRVPDLPGFFWEKSKSMTPLLQYVAKEGFHTVSVSLMKRLLKEPGVG